MTFGEHNEVKFATPERENSLAKTKGVFFDVNAESSSPTHTRFGVEYFTFTDFINVADNVHTHRTTIPITTRLS